MEQAWSNFCDVLERRIGAQNMEIWVKSGVLRPERLDPRGARLRAESKYSYDWIRDNLLRDIETSLAESVGEPIPVELTWDGAPQSAVETPARARRSTSHLDRTMTFETFVVGKCNEFAHAAAMAVADAPGQAHNPLFIYGGAGLGKTHLMHALGNRVAQRTGHNNVYYLTGQQFFDGMVRAFQNRSIQEFRERFRTEVDVLLLDDVQFIAGRDRTEEEVFYVFEMMRAEGKQIVLAADQPPQEIGKLEPRLRTRFSCGLIADVSPPDPETMMAILGNKAHAMRLDVPKDVQELIAHRVRNSVRELEGVLNRLSALHSFYGRPVSMAFIHERMADVLPPEAPPPSAEVIIQRVADHYHIRAAEIKGDRRPANIAHPRQLAMYLTRSVCKLSFPEIGRIFERDNSTVQYACKKVAQEMKKDPNLRAEVDLLEKIVRGLV